MNRQGAKSAKGEEMGSTPGNQATGQPGNEATRQPGNEGTRPTPDEVAIIVAYDAIRPAAMAAWHRAYGVDLSEVSPLALLCWLLSRALVEAGNETVLTEKQVGNARLLRIVNRQSSTVNPLGRIDRIALEVSRQASKETLALELIRWECDRLAGDGDGDGRIFSVAEKVRRHEQATR